MRRGVRHLDTQVAGGLFYFPNGTADALLLYLHGGGYSAFDKGGPTETWFRHLTAQGHVVMDVAYRLIPEATVPEMQGDVKRAVAWLKRNAGRYGVDPHKLVLSGGSGGSHLALLAAYAPHHPLFTPEDVRGMDLSVEVPNDELGAVATAEMWEEIYDRLAHHIQGQRSPLVFVNPRRLSERVARALGERLGEQAVLAHHGSLSRTLRLDAETRLKYGQLKAVVATASLELGIDIGTTNTKAVAFDLQGKPVAQANSTYPFISTQQGYHELDPQVRHVLTQQRRRGESNRGSALDRPAPRELRF